MMTVGSTSDGAVTPKLNTIRSPGRAMLACGFVDRSVIESTISSGKDFRFVSRQTMRLAEMAATITRTKIAVRVRRFM
jgi:hypothetical protein